MWVVVCVCVKQRGAAGRKLRRRRRHTRGAAHAKSQHITAHVMTRHSCLCARCAAVIEWKRTYRKYKALTRPRKCTGCAQPRVKLAYHVLCAACAEARGRVCPKCLKGRAEADLERQRAAEPIVRYVELDERRRQRGHIDEIVARDVEALERCERDEHRRQARELV